MAKSYDDRVAELNALFDRAIRIQEDLVERVELTHLIGAPDKDFTAAHISLMNSIIKVRSMSKEYDQVIRQANLERAAELAADANEEAARSEVVIQAYCKAVAVQLPRSSLM